MIGRLIFSEFDDDSSSSPDDPIDRLEMLRFVRQTLGLAPPPLVENSDSEPEFTCVYCGATRTGGLQCWQCGTQFSDAEVFSDEEVCSECGEPYANHESLNTANTYYEKQQFCRECATNHSYESVPPCASSYKWKIGHIEDVSLIDLTSDPFLLDGCVW